MNKVASKAAQKSDEEVTAMFDVVASCQAKRKVKISTDPAKFISYKDR